MATIVTRAGKGSPLTHNEVDANFVNLNTDKVEKSGTDPVVINVSSTSNALRVTQTGTGNAFVVEDSTNPDSTPFVIDTAGSVIVGHTAKINLVNPNTGAASAPAFENVATSIAGASSGTILYVNNAGQAGYYAFAKSRGATVGDMTTMQSGDNLGYFSWQGSDGTNFIRAADITAAVDGTPGTNDMPGRLVFSTTADGASTPTERMRINSSGNVGIGTISPAEKLTVSGNASLSGNLTFTGTGNRMTGDFSNATIANRVMFQTSTVNGITSVAYIPNGTATDTYQVLYSGTDLNNTSGLLLRSAATESQLNAFKSGTGTYLPMTFYTGGSERMRIDTTGAIGLSGANYGTSGQVLTSNGSASAPTWQAVSGVPAGAVSYFAMNTAPTGWLKANGAVVSRTTYATLFAAIGTTFGVGDGSTTFGLPDLRGDFIRSWDDGAGVDPARVFGSSQADAMRNLTGTYSSQSLRSTAAIANGIFAAYVGTGTGGSSGAGGTAGGFTFDASRQVTTAAEFRPVNTALLACIKF